MCPRCREARLGEVDRQLRKLACMACGFATGETEQEKFETWLRGAKRYGVESGGASYQRPNRTVVLEAKRVPRIPF